VVRLAGTFGRLGFDSALSLADGCGMTLDAAEKALAEIRSAM
jgi:hypothetical protein